MHLLRTESRSLDEAEAAIDLAQTPADLVFLSFSDSDLGAVAAAARSRPGGAMSVRLANLAVLKHPYSIDLYAEKVIAKSRFILIRLLGGLDYWRYGVEEFCRIARAHGVLLAIIPGDAAEDQRLAEASNMAAEDLKEIFARFQSGSAGNIGAVLDWIEHRLDAPAVWGVKQTIAAAGVFTAGRRLTRGAKRRALIIFYRSYMLVDDTAPIIALADALAARGFDVEPIFVTSLKDVGAVRFLHETIACGKPDVVLNATAFSARLDEGGSVLDEADAPVLQVIFSGAGEAQWKADPRGLCGADLAMNVVLPEMDGRLITRAIAFKRQASPRPDLEFTPLVHAACDSRVAFVSDLATAWVDLRKTAPAERRLACILSDYPGKAGRGGYAVGLDTAKSVASIAEMLREAGYAIGPLPHEDHLMRSLESGAETARLSLADYEEALRDMPRPFTETLNAQWGDPASDPDAIEGFFSFPILHAQNFYVAMQPDRGSSAERKAQYHDVALAPRHAYVAFYVWLRRVAGIHAIIHCGAHGTLEWLPGKAIALSEACAPEAVLGATPVIYPFIVNNPGEAAQAKRRLSALIIGHLTPPLTSAQSHGAAQEIEALLDEYASAEMLDRRRARLLAKAILARAKETGLAQDCGLNDDDDPIGGLQRLDAWLCDLKDMRIGDGLHVFGRAPAAAVRDANVATLAKANGAGDAAPLSALIDRCAEAEREGLLAALDGRFVQPGPGGAPSRGRIDVLPTGRNLYGVDPRAVPTRTAWEIGQRAAQEVLSRHAQDNGEWPKRIVMDLWASATMRTGGDDLAQALALLGVKPVWDNASSRVTGFEIISPARLDRPRVDVTLRISGLFRDVFPAQIALFDSAVRAVSEIDEDDEANPLAAARRAAGVAPSRIFGAAPSAYGLGLSRAMDADATLSREELGQLYLDATSHAYGGARGEGIASPGFTERVASADAMIHVQDQDEQDLLDSDAIVDHEGGFAAAAQLLGNDAPIYHVETTRPGAIKVRTLPEEVARIVRGRASNPRWIRGQMRHGHRGGAEIAETVDHLFTLAVMSDAVSSQHFELLFDATCGDPDVRDFLVAENPKAALCILARFEAALRRGFWQGRRNSTLDTLASMRKSLSC
ncbi:cobaltochelatase subunit CobN [Methylocella tundrae]|uniref:Cobaltochelatase subunit CobN n=1 Tax=Methylocella tundrae TaxID=227605 RepID=A0A4U8Z105_METTU|nr:cobaltochelatase subunit CobN [Methylocella tundrae]WPP06283.1 cobaltochelatase subunit CobN [Methylocella tundrae]VFU08966.1 Cobaltochelatase subunit CobN [Methylocella tundrae]